MLTNFEWPYATGRPIHSVFGARMGFSGSADRMALLPVGPDPNWRLGNFERPNDQDRVANKFNFTQTILEEIRTGPPRSYF